ncbi:MULTISPECIES: LysR family transcriptional regulator [Lachnospiraceae]|uniref:LysR family transcriptional regulator n=1 Tax=Lachnospiraceae TaxID=186803 RepID=UPI001F3EFF31|nr:LysR family transcriptional regulator [Faecalicatena contorta]MCF2667835.1 LysR family transcriptional regulator [Faecalicatena contorta]
MTLNQIYYFQTVARYENYRKAAEELYISQPSLSRSIASLESELGVLLFEKNGRGVNLTKGGKLFLEYADRIIDECEIAKNKMKEMASDGGKIDIGYVFPLASHYIPHNVRDFLNKKENKNVTFNFFQNHTSAIAKKVRSGELDVGFGGYIDKEEFEFFPVLSEEMVLITPKGHELESHKKVSIQELRNYPVIGYDRESWLGNYTKQLYRRLAFQPNIVVECPDEHSIVALVSEDFGIALVPAIEEINENRVNIHRFDDIELMHHTFMFWMRDRYQLPAVERFIEYMKQKAPSLE